MRSGRRRVTGRAYHAASGPRRGFGAPALAERGWYPDRSMAKGGTVPKAPHSGGDPRSGAPDPIARRDPSAALRAYGVVQDGGDPPAAASEPRPLAGRYVIHGEIGRGGMAVIHFGRLLGPAGFSRTVAIKRADPKYARDPEVVSMLLDEARVASRIRHPNVLSPFEVVEEDGEYFVIMEYVQGESFARLMQVTRERGERVPPAVAATVLVEALRGLHAAHLATSERGEPLGIVHRDVAPQNVLVGIDGVARVLDFGVAKASGRMQVTRVGQLKGTLCYMAPEQLAGVVTPRSDVYSASVMLWEALTGKRLVTGKTMVEMADRIGRPAPPPSTVAPGVHRVWDEIVARGMALDPDDRYASAREMAVDIEEAVDLATATAVGDWVASLVPSALEARAAELGRIESVTAIDVPIGVRPAVARRSVAPGPAPRVEPRPPSLRWRLPLLVFAALAIGAAAFVTGGWVRQCQGTAERP